MSKGKFITFEGGEGSGKSTQSRLLVESFRKYNINVLNTREPGGTAGAENIRQLLVTGDIHKWEPLTETFLHLAARKDHVEKLIKPSLAKGVFVICDRFSDSTISYQGYGHGLGITLINQLQLLAIENFKPDLTFILDIDIDKGISRADKRGNTEDRYEKMGIKFHKKVRKGFLDIAKKDNKRCQLINADDTIENIHNRIICITNEKLNITLKCVL